MIIQNAKYVGNSNSYQLNLSETNSELTELHYFLESGSSGCFGVFSFNVPDFEFYAVCCKTKWIPEASNERQLPLSESMPSRRNCKAAVGVKVRWAPATIAASHCSCRIASTASCSAHKDEEQAVSTEKDGPKQY